MECIIPEYQLAFRSGVSPMLSRPMMLGTERTSSIERSTASISVGANSGGRMALRIRLNHFDMIMLILQRLRSLPRLTVPRPLLLLLPIPS